MGIMEDNTRRVAEWLAVDPEYRDQAQDAARQGELMFVAYMQTALLKIAATRSTPQAWEVVRALGPDGILLLDLDALRSEVLARADATSTTGPAKTLVDLFTSHVSDRGDGPQPVNMATLRAAIGAGARDSGKAVPLVRVDTNHTANHLGMYPVDLVLEEAIGFAAALIDRAMDARELVIDEDTAVQDIIILLTQLQQVDGALADARTRLLADLEPPAEDAATDTDPTD